MLPGKGTVMLEKQFQELMKDRNGSDDFNTFLLGLYLSFYVLLWSRQEDFYTFFATLSICLFIFRFFSKNIKKRQRENHVYMRYTAPVFGWFRVKLAIYLDKKHRYFRCPKCNCQMRAPRDTGKIRVTCGNCQNVFEEES